MTISRYIGLAIVALPIWGIMWLGGTPGIFLDIPSLLILVLFLIGGQMLCFGWTPSDRAWAAALGRGPLDPAQAQRHTRVLEAAHGLTWAAAVLGFLMGNVAMMANLADPSSIGAGIAVAMVPLVYAGILAEFIIRPLRYGLIARTDPNPTNPQSPNTAPVGETSTKPIVSMNAVGMVSWSGWIVVLVLTLYMSQMHTAEAEKNQAYLDVIESIQEHFGYEGGVDEDNYDLLDDL